MAFAHIVVLSGAGLSAASGIPTFRGPGGLWEGHEAMSLATPQAWRADRALVRRFYDMRRRVAAAAEPNAGHHALAHLVARGGGRVHLVTQNVDGLLARAGAPDALELHGNVHRLRCEAHAGHPRVDVAGEQAPEARCAVCGALLRPDIVWFGEVPHHLDEVERLLRRCDLFVSVGTSGVVYPAAGFGAVAREAGAHTVEVNPEPSGAMWVQQVVREAAEVALPRLVDAWLQAS